MRMRSSTASYIVVILLAAGAIIYLNRAYSFIYMTIGRQNLPSPTGQLVEDTILPSHPSTRQFTYLALGDSLTAGVGAASFTDSYPYRLGQRLAEDKQATVHLINLGDPGATSADVLNKQIPLLSTYKPDFVTLLIGVNDVHNFVGAAPYKKNLLMILDALSQRHIPAAVMNIPYLGSPTVFHFPYGMIFDLRTKYYNQALAGVTARYPIGVVDLYGLTRSSADASSSYYSSDGFHPSGTAYRLWADLIYDTLRN